MYAFCFTLFLKDFDTFHEPFLKHFFPFSDNIQLTFLFIEKKVIKKCLMNFSYTLKN